MPSLKNYYKTRCLPKVGTHGFEGISPLWPPFLGKAIKLSFSTSPKTLSLRFDLAPVYREAELTESNAEFEKELCVFEPVFLPTQC